MNAESIKKNLILFFCFWLIYGLLAFLLLHTPYYDWFNYHHYNSWAYFNNRYDMDFLAANHRSYFIPYVDLLQYYLFNKLKLLPYLFIFLEAFDNALILTLAYKLGGVLFQVPEKNKLFFNIYNTVFVSLSPIFLLLLNFSMNDTKVAIFILSGVYILIKNIFEHEKPHRLRNIFISGLFVGVALALKLTSVIYVLTLFLILLLMFKRMEKPYKTILLFCSGVALSFVVISGHWYYTMYKHFKNPFFPYYNEIFKSEYGPSLKLLQSDFEHVKARNIVEFIFFPFYVSGTHTFGNSEYSYDLRFAFIFISFLLMIPYLIYFEKNKKEPLFVGIIPVNNMWFLIYFIAISFYIDLYFFGTYRYIISTSLLFGFIAIIFSYMLTEILKLKMNYPIGISLMIFLIVIGFTRPFPNINMIYNYHSHSGTIFTYHDCNFEDDSYVFITNTLLSYILPYQNPKAHYVFLPFPKNFKYPKKDIYRKNDLIFSSKVLYYPYIKKYISDIMKSDKKVYVIGYLDKSSVGTYNKAFNHYSKGSRKLTNCKKAYFRIFIYTKFIDYCEYNKIKYNEIRKFK